MQLQLYMAQIVNKITFCGIVFVFRLLHSTVLHKLLNNNNNNNKIFI